MMLIVVGDLSSLYVINYSQAISPVLKTSFSAAAMINR